MFKQERFIQAVQGTRTQHKPTLEVRRNLDSAGTYQASPSTLARQFLPVLTTTLSRLADAQSERVATTSQSGKSQGEAPQPNIHSTPVPTVLSLFVMSNMVRLLPNMLWHGR
jgi:hypothetical protein